MQPKKPGSTGSTTCSACITVSTTGPNSPKAPMYSLMPSTELNRPVSQPHSRNAAEITSSAASSTVKSSLNLSARPFIRLTPFSPIIERIS